MSSPQRFRKKPVVIEAMRYDSAESCVAIHRWMGDDEHTLSPDCGWVSFAIDTLEGQMEATIGDWIIKGVAGEFYPCKPDIFEATYEAADRDGGQ